ncbi:hypothetical protein HYU22_03700 [Candidatus Woesearchaeota archaeon]|nr:hypothetical protein [Candidatus Woesearchaeota archaeon]
MNPESLERKIENAPTPGLPARVKEWLRRYGLAEVIGTAAAYACFFLGQELTDNDIIAAYAGTMGENLGFYGTMVVREVNAGVKKARVDGKSYGLVDALKTASKLAAEFGPAEVLDSLVVRPTTMGFGSRIFGKELGVGIGKAAADVSFYVPTIISYELEKYFSRRGVPSDS